MGPWGLGFGLAYFYRQVLNYRKLRGTDECKKNLFPKIHFLHKNSVVCRTLFVLAVAVVMTNFLIPFKANEDPENWSRFTTSLYYGISRVTFAFAVCVIFAVIVLGHMEPGRIFLTNDYFRSLGKLAYITALF